MLVVVLVVVVVVVSIPRSFSRTKAKGKGGEQALKILEGIDGLDLVLVVVPFFYSNFLAFFTPLSTPTQWELSASFGDGSTKIDMMNVTDLGVVVRKYQTATAAIMRINQQSNSDQ